MEKRMEIDELSGAGTGTFGVYATHRNMPAPNECGSQDIAPTQRVQWNIHTSLEKRESNPDHETVGKRAGLETSLS